MQNDNFENSHRNPSKNTNDRMFSYYNQLFEKSPKAWWNAMEGIRSKRGQLPKTMRRKCILYSPNYDGNSYQNSLYREYKPFNFKLLSFNHLEINDHLVEATFARKLIFHQHWLKNIYWDCISLDSGFATIDKHIGIIKALKAYKALICWTLHNIIDHDATPLQEQLSDYAVNKIADVSDHIFIHSKGAGKRLSRKIGKDLSRKFILLEHPLYDEMLCLSKQPLPVEIKQEKILGKRVLVAAGMIRPYKGVPDLIAAFQQVVKQNEKHGLHLIIAGQVYDRKVTDALDHLDIKTRACISLVARRLSNGELSSLIQRADVLVTPYKKILTSGSYYLATTFAKPTVAPRIGMFAELSDSDEVAFLYDGSLDSLTRILTRISMLPKEYLVRVGQNALSACKHLYSIEVSKRYFKHLEAGNE